MNLIRKAITTLLTSLCALELAPREYYYYINTPSFGNYASHCSDKKINLLNKTNRIIRNGRNRLRVFDKNNQIVYESYYKKVELSLSATANVEITLPTSQFLTEDGMHCLLSLVDGDTLQSYVDYDFTLFPTDSRYSYNLNTFSNKTIRLCPTLIRLIDGKVNDNCVSYDFSGCSDYLKIDTYYRLNLSSLTFVSTGTSIPDLEKGYLYFEDYLDCFSSLVDSDGEVKIPIKITGPKTNTKSFDFADLFYVEPSSLKMSLTPKIGYVQTPYFYFPINRLNDVLKQKFVMKLIGFGNSTSRINVSFETYFNSTVTLIGDCSNSEYCVVGGIR